MKILCVIPSRIASTRLPKKPLKIIKDKPMIQMVYEQAIQCPNIDKVVVSTDHEDIAQVIQKIGGEVHITDSNIPTGTDRVAATAINYPEMDLIINLQGDQPFVKPEMLTELIRPYLEGRSPDMTTLSCPLADKDINNPHVVKVIYNNKSQAIYFSRAPIPYYRNQIKCPVRQHLGLYTYTKEFLNKYKSLAPSSLEQAEELEQLRVIENGYNIELCFTNYNLLEINTLEDLIQAQNY